MPVSSIEEECLKSLKAKPMSVSELAKKLNVRRYFLTGYLESMKDRNLLDLVKVGKANVYIVKEGRK
jgi:Mn-dependent DtxR family transcriptional regulator